MLRNIRFLEKENEAQLYCGEIVRQRLLDEGWIERLPDGPTGTRYYRITSAGLTAVDMPEPPAPKRPKLKTFAPKVRTLDTSIVKPRK